MTNKIVFIFECVMSVFYLAVAVVFLFTKYFPTVSGGIRIALGVVFALYGIYRVWRAVKKIIQT